MSDTCMEAETKSEDNYTQLSHDKFDYDPELSQQYAPKSDVNEFDFATPGKSSNKNPTLEQDMKYTYPALMTNPYDRENWTISMDHCYSRPWNWRPEASFLRPTKTLFIPKTIATKRSSNPLAPLQECEDTIDVESVTENPNAAYDVGKGTAMMEECDKVAILARMEKNREDWEENISKINWTPSQNRIFSSMVNILNSFHLSRLAQTGAFNEPLLRRAIIDKSVQRVRRLLATISWDPKLTQWIHQLLIDNLSVDYLAAYLDILRTLKAKLPSFVEKMIYGPNSSTRMGVLNNESLFNLMKRTWDPVAPSLHLDKPKKLPGNPIIIVVPSAPVMSKRNHKWINNLSNLATVVTIPTNFGHRMSILHCLDQMFATTRGKIQEIRTNYPGRNIVLLGFNAGGTLALQIAQVEPVLCVVSLGFSLLTAEGKRGEPDDNLLELQCPVLFVIGQCSSTSLQEDVEDLRERMRIETGLIVVGSADEHLRVSKKKRKSEGITQSIVDRCIVDEVGEFISGIILSPFPPQVRQSPTHFPAEVKKGKTERKRYNSNASSLDSEPPSPTPRITRPGSNNSSPNFGRPPGSKSKSRLETKWAAQIAQGTPFTPSPSTSPPPPLYISNTPDTSSNDSSLTDKSLGPTKSTSSNEPSVPPVKKIKTLKPVTPADRAARQTASPWAGTETPAAKMQAYGLNRSLMSQGNLSTLLQGGIKTIPPTQPKLSTSVTNTGIKVLENVQLNSNATAKLIGNAGRTFDLSKITLINSVNTGKTTGNMGNVVLLPDGKIKTVGNTVKGTGNTPILLPISGSSKSGATQRESKSSRGKYITSKRQLIGNKPPRPLKKVPYIPTSSAITTTLPPPTNLTTQDIMDLPIIFADDNQIIDNSLVTEVPSSLVQSSSQTKIITSTPGNKFVLLNKQANPQNFIITPNMKKPQTKFTKIILSKRSPSDELKAGKIATLSPEITVKKVAAQESSIIAIESDYDNAIAASALIKPNFSASDAKNLTIISKKPGEQFKPLAAYVDEVRKRVSENLHEDESDPDYIPPKNIKLDS